MFGARFNQPSKKLDHWEHSRAAVAKLPAANLLWWSCHRRSSCPLWPKWRSSSPVAWSTVWNPEPKKGSRGEKSQLNYTHRGTTPPLLVRCLWNTVMVMCVLLSWSIYIYILRLWLCPMDSPFCWWLGTCVCHFSYSCIISLQLLYMFNIFAYRIVYKLFVYKSKQWFQIVSPWPFRQGHCSFWNWFKTVYFGAFKSWPAHSRSGRINRNPNYAYTCAMELQTVQSSVSSAKYYIQYFIVSGWQFVSRKEYTTILFEHVFVCLKS